MNRWIRAAIVTGLNVLAGLTFASSFGAHEILPAVTITVAVSTAVVAVTAGRGARARWTALAGVVALPVSLVLAGAWANAQAGFEPSTTVDMVGRGVFDGWWAVLTFDGSGSHPGRPGGSGRTRGVRLAIVVVDVRAPSGQSGYT